MCAPISGCSPDRSPGNTMLSSVRFFTHFVLSASEKIVVIAGFKGIDNTYLVCVCVFMSTLTLSDLRIKLNHFDVKFIQIRSEDPQIILEIASRQNTTMPSPNFLKHQK